MKKVTLIGDCHSSRLLYYWNPNKCPVDLFVWGRGGQSAWNFNPKELFGQNTLSTQLEEFPKYLDPIDEEMHKKLKNEYRQGFSKIKDEGIILIWLGYIDSKTHLPMPEKSNNTEECVLRYLNATKSFFKNAEIRFIEPFPQFIPFIGNKEEKQIEWDYQIRKEKNDEFIYYLNLYCDQFGFKEPISQKQIFNALGFYEEDMTYNKAKISFSGTILDTFRHEDLEKIYNLFIEEAQKE
jgi:hypothetical protein